MSSQEEKLQQLVNKATKILIIQADNPDADSLGSAIALEQIFTLLKKDSYLFCSVSIADHLKHLTGWSRVSSVLPSSFDMSIVVDTSSVSLLESLEGSGQALIKSKPLVILDHHQSQATIDFADLVINRPVVATGELIYDLAKSLNWQLTSEARDMIATSIMYDSLGLTSAATTAKSIRVIADLVEAGVNLTEMDARRREMYRKSLELTKYKGQLLQRIESYLDDQLAIITIPWEEIEKYSPLYNPSMLVIEDMRLIQNNRIAIAIKIYKDNKMTAKLRANYASPIAAKLAEHFGGGGHDYASGFKTSDYDSVEDLKKDIITQTKQLIDGLDK